MLLKGLFKKFLEAFREPLEQPVLDLKELEMRPIVEVEDPCPAPIPKPASPIEEAKEICVRELLIPFEGTGPRTKQGQFKAYKDPGSTDGLPITIAWGLTYHADGRSIQLGEEWSLNYALQVKAIVLNKFVAGVLNLCPVLLTEDPRRLAAVVSFAYNVGLGNLKISILRKKINQKDWIGASEQFKRWNKAGGKIMKGLTRRRAAEAKMFLLEN